MFSILVAAGWPVVPLLLCSVIATALVIERFISLKSSKVLPPQLLGEAIGVSQGSIPSPDVVAKLERNSALGEMLAAGFRAAQAGGPATADDLRAAMESTGRAIAHRLERYLPALATIASAAPLLGLLGTVIGMIEIFGSQAPGAGGGGNPAQLAHGISIALYNTAFGLVVAVPTLIFWRYFRTRVDGYLLHMELAGDRFAEHLARIRPGAGSAP
ncbi:MotA/TolQ/ExbB proton channel family protein [uncultured Pseudacidovorax sp.]|uniref:MotA/TolQ/ExbB proton channel family protein n=1 Tax=uncultured Pseudacidovorax sp. TaxID=679313 RepID=UPI0025E42F58|nr:MotA/TolQ/ExbB proton channel family protein [uncultured Pseudacidovorax sp.]